MVRTEFRDAYSYALMSRDTLYLSKFVEKNRLSRHECNLFFDTIGVEKLEIKISDRLLEELAQYSEDILGDTLNDDINYYLRYFMAPAAFNKLPIKDDPEETISILIENIFSCSKNLNGLKDMILETLTKGVMYSITGTDQYRWYVILSEKVYQFIIENVNNNDTIKESLFRHLKTRASGDTCFYRNRRLAEDGLHPGRENDSKLAIAGYNAYKGSNSADRHSALSFIQSLIESNRCCDELKELIGSLSTSKIAEERKLYMLLKYGK